jgi:hypothetical protein
MNDTSINFIELSNPGIFVAGQSIGRMGICNELLMKSQRLRGTPVVDAPTSWQYLTWKLEYDAGRTEPARGATDLHVVRGIQSAVDTEVQWLGRVPPAALIELRRTGAMEEIRSMLRNGIEGLANAAPANFRATSQQVLQNVQEAFLAHQAKVDALRRKKWTFAGSDIGSWLVVGSLAVTAAATGVPVWGLAAIAADQLLPAPKLRDIPRSIRTLARESSKLRRSPVGLLFDYRPQ